MYETVILPQRDPSSCLIELLFSSFDATDVHDHYMHCHQGLLAFGCTSIVGGIACLSVCLECVILMLTWGIHLEW